MSRGHARVEIISGDPGVGKTYYVAHKRLRGDLVWDLDNIADVMAQCPEWPRPPHVLDALMAMRDALVAWIQQKSDPQQRIYLIISDPLDAERVLKVLPSATHRHLTGSMEGGG
jgi:hypothetical protein